MAGGSSSPELFTAIIGIEIELKDLVFSFFMIFKFRNFCRER
jgi:hypothetical protein